MKHVLGTLALAAATYAAPAVADETLNLDAPASSEVESSEMERLGYWRCDAWYVYNPYYNWYWIGPNLAYSRAQALGACQANFGFNCQYRCNVY